MPPETPTPFWKKLVPKPSGSIPGGLFSQVAIGLIAVMGGAMIAHLSVLRSGGTDPRRYWRTAGTRRRRRWIR